MVVASLAAFLVGQLILGDGKNTTLAADGVLRAVIGSGLYLAGIGVFGIAVGALMRNTAGAISVVVAALLIIPGLARLVLPDSWNTTLTPYLPSNAGSAFTSVTGRTPCSAPGRRGRGVRRLAGGAAGRGRSADPPPGCLKPHPRRLTDHDRRDGARGNGPGPPPTGRPGGRAVDGIQRRRVVHPEPPAADVVQGVPQPPAPVRRRAGRGDLPRATPGR